MFRPLTAITARWAPVSGPGLEHLTLTSTDEGFTARSVVVGGDEADWGLSYEIDCAPDWTVRRAALKRTDGLVLTLLSDGRGRWRDSVGAEIAVLAGCIDIDIAGTPFTNTLPVRRTGLLVADGPAEFAMAYIWPDRMVFDRDGQRYTALLDGRNYLFEETDGTFSAQIAFDEDGLVADYPGLFRRLL